MEGEKLWDFLSFRNGHVILNSVQASQDEVEDGDCVAQGVWKLLDDNGKAAINRNKQRMTQAAGPYVYVKQRIASSALAWLHASLFIHKF